MATGSFWRSRSGGALLSQFNYTYDAVGNIQTWRQAHSGAVDPVKYHFGYDRADQLISAALKDESTGATIKQFGYAYDRAGNRLNEQIDNSVTTAGYNNLNQLTTHSAGGKMTFEGSIDEPATVTIGGNQAEILPANEFRGTADVQPGQNDIPITAVDARGNTTTKSIQVNVPTGAVREFSYDLNGNMLSDGEKTYGWDAANRLVKITISANMYEFVYNGAGQRVEEKLNGSTIKRFIWCGMDLREERDASGLNVVKQFFGGGMQLGSSNYYYTRDHLGSVREMTDASGALRARYDYDPWGRRTKLSGDMEADFGFTGHYFHAASELHLAFYRAYDAELGRWLSRDPIETAIGEIPEMLPEGPNLYTYVGGNPTTRIDPLGLFWGNYCGEGSKGGAPKDCLDRACKKHDDCYEKCGAAGLGGVISALWNRCVRACDKALCRAASKCARECSVRSKERYAAAAVQVVFCYW